MSLMKRMEEDTSSEQSSGLGGVSAARLPTSRGVSVAEASQTGDIVSRVQQRLLFELGDTLNFKDKPKMQAAVESMFDVVLSEEGIILSRAMRKQVFEEVIAELLGLGPIEPLLKDEATSDIMVIGPERVYVERGGKVQKTNIRFQDKAHLMRIIDRILAPLGRRVDESSPTVDARLPDGSRVNVVVPPVALDGPVLTIRKFAVVPLTVDDLIANGTAPAEVFEFIRAAVIAQYNILVSGGSSSGKTTLLNVMSSYVPEWERVVTIENAAELQLQQEHVVRLESRPANIEDQGEITIRDLVINALRMRPDRIIVGEVRSSEALDLLQAMNTGHEGSMGTIHANSPRDVFSRLETMVLTAGMNLPLRAIREQMSSAIDLVIHMGRDASGQRRILSISEVAGLEGSLISLSELFRWESLPGRASAGQLVATGLKPRKMDRIEDAGVMLPAAIFQPPAWMGGAGRTVEASSASRRPPAHRPPTSPSSEGASRADSGTKQSD